MATKSGGHDFAGSLRLESDRRRPLNAKVLGEQVRSELGARDSNSASVAVSMTSPGISDWLHQTSASGSQSALT
jgi:hypothetical protein